MRLLTLHKILIAAAVGLGAVLALWGAVHGRRGESGAWWVCVVGLLMLPAGALYLRKLKRNPPIK